MAASSSAPVAVRKMHRSKSEAYDMSWMEHTEKIERAIDWEQGAASMKAILAGLELKERASEALRDPKQRRFTMFMSLLVLLSVVSITIETQIGHVSAANPFDFWFFAEVFFFIVFGAEICIRVAQERWQWAHNRWNWIDALCVVPAFVSIIVAFTDVSGGFVLLNMMRLLKLARLIRSMKIMTYCRSLYTVAMLWLQAMTGICSVGVMILLGLLLYSITSAVLIGHDEELKRIPMGEETAEHFYGSVQSSFITLFTLITLDGFEEKTRPLLEKRPGLIVFFMSFAMIFTFGLLNMLIGLVVERTLLESERLKHERFYDEHPLNQSKLCRVFSILDPENTGIITRSQFESHVKENEDVRQCLEKEGFPLCDMRDFFNVADVDGSGNIDMQKFVFGFVRLYGRSREEVRDMSTHACVRVLDQRMECFLNSQTQLYAKIEEYTGKMKHIEAAVSSIQQGLSSKILVRARPSIGENIGDAGDLAGPQSPIESQPCCETSLRSILGQVLNVKEQIIKHVSQLEVEFQSKTYLGNKTVISHVGDGDSLQSTNIHASRIDRISMLEEQLSCKLKALETFKECLDRKFQELLDQRQTWTLLAEQDLIMREHIDCKLRLENLTAHTQRQHHVHHSSTPDQRPTSETKASV